MSPINKKLLISFVVLSCLAVKADPPSAFTLGYTEDDGINQELLCVEASTKSFDEGKVGYICGLKNKKASLVPGSEQKAKKKAPGKKPGGDSKPKKSGAGDGSGESKKPVKEPKQSPIKPPEDNSDDSDTDNPSEPTKPGDSGTKDKSGKGGGSGTNPNKTKIPAYETDENGDPLLDENGKPIPLLDDKGNPVYVDSNIVSLLK